MFRFFRFKAARRNALGAFILMSCKGEVAEEAKSEAPTASSSLEAISNALDIFTIDSSDPKNWGGQFPEENEYVSLGLINDPFIDDEFNRLRAFLKGHGLRLSCAQSHVGVAQLEIKWKEFSLARRLIIENPERFSSFMKFEKIAQ